MKVTIMYNNPDEWMVVYCDGKEYLGMGHLSIYREVIKEGSPPPVPSSNNPPLEEVEDNIGEWFTYSEEIKEYIKEHKLISQVQDREYKNVRLRNN